MTILVTRPSPAGEQLVSRLQAIGLTASHFPLIAFGPGRQLPELAAKLAALKPGALVIVLSQHVTDYALTELQHVASTGSVHCHWFAIGRTTALRLHSLIRLPVHYPKDRETSEVLLQLPELQSVAGKQVLILRGNGGRALLADTLTQRGALVDYCECYQRLEKQYDGREEAYRWSQHPVSTLVVTSGEMLRQLYNMIPDWYRQHWLLRCLLVVVSERLAMIARQLGWQTILIADNADNDALLHALHSHFTTGWNHDGTRP